MTGGFIAEPLYYPALFLVYLINDQLRILGDDKFQVVLKQIWGLVHNYNVHILQNLCPL